jgi:hypothetical protein
LYSAEELVASFFSFFFHMNVAVFAGVVIGLRRHDAQAGLSSIFVCFVLVWVVGKLTDPFRDQAF